MIAIARLIIAALFIVMALGIVITFAKVRRRGLLLGAGAYGAAGMLAISLDAWWPLIAGFAAAWLFRRLVLNPRTDLRLDLPTISKHDVAGDRPIQEYLQWWLSNDVQVRLVTTPFVEEAWRTGFRKPAHVPHDRSWEASTAEAAWRDMTIADIRNLASASRDEFTKHLDEIDALSTPTLIAAGNMTDRYDLPTVPSDFASVARSVPTDEERKSYAENYVADALLAARLRVLAWTYQCWHGERYELPHKRARS